MNRPAVILANFEASTHFMYARLLRRAGLTPEQFDVLFADDLSMHSKLAQLRPSVAIAMGEHALFAVLGQWGILRWVNRAKVVRVYDSFAGENVSIPVVFNFAPEALVYQHASEETEDDDYDGPRKKRKKTRVLRNPPRYQGMAVGILRRALHIAEHGVPTPPPQDYLLDPTPEQFAEWADQCLTALHDPDQSKARFLSWDIETPYKMRERDEEDFEEEARAQDNTILRISFSYLPGVAVSVPWQGPWMQTIKDLLAFRGNHIGWNIAGFDVPMVEANGIAIGGRVLDMMDGFHLLQPDMDKGLEFVSGVYTALDPWKHLADEFGREALYSCFDADAALQNALGIQAGLEKQRIWDLFVRQMELARILYEAGQRGNVIDTDAQNALEVELSELLRVALLDAQDLVPPEYKRAKLYRRLPKGAIPTEWVEGEKEVLTRTCSKCGKTNVNAKTHPCCKKGEGTIEMQPVVTPFFARVWLPRTATLDEVKDWLASNGFNPNSTDQMLAYVKGHNHPVGYNHKTGMDSADGKQLKKLAVKYGDKHPIYKHTVEIHKISKALSTYVFGMRPDKANRVHSTYVNAPWTWRLSSRNVNMQNQGKREDNPYAKKARKTIIASPGNMLVQADSSAIEAVFVGYFMNDPEYIKLARQSVHAFVACHRLGWEFHPDNVKKVKAEQAALYEAVKTVVHGTNFGMTPYLMHMNRPDLFPRMKDAKEMQQLLFDALPGLKKWHWELRQFAQKNNYLVSPWGVKFYFYDVFSYKRDANREIQYHENGDPIITLGKDGKRVVAALPQSSAGFFMRDNLVMLGQTKARQWMGANVSVHDGYCLDVPVAQVDEAIDILSHILTRPIVEMGGLQVGCEIEVGPNWGAMKKVKTVNVS